MPAVTGADRTPSILDPLNRDKPVQTFRCPYCPKVFKRSEHRARHELSHTNLKPFACQFCHKTYARKDLVKRHERTIHADLYNALPEAQRAKQPCSAVGGEQHDSQTDPAPPGADSHPVHISPHNADFEAITIVSDNELHALDQAIDDSACATVSNLVDPTHRHASGSARSLSVHLPDGSAPIVMPDAASASVVLETTSAVDTQDRGAPQALSPGTHREESRDSIMDLLTPSCFDPFIAPAGNVDTSESEQPQRKRQRRCENAPVTQAHPNGQSTFGTPAMSSFPEDPECLLPSAGFGAFGQDGNDLFFQQLIEQHDRFLDTLGYGDFGIADSYQFPPRKSVSIASSQDHSPALQSDSATAKPGRNRLPMIQKEKMENLPHIVVDEAAFQAFCLGLGNRMGTSDTNTIIKNRRELQHFLNGYLSYFHRHLPVVHVPTLDVSKTPSPLILALCCIGALYRLERQKARNIYLAATHIIEVVDTRPDCSSPDSSASTNSFEEQHAAQTTTAKPLWWMQTRVLLLLYAMLGSDTATLQSEIGKMGVIMTHYRTRRAALRARSQQEKEPQWQDWIEVEGTKRLLCALYIQSSLFMLLYDFPPGFGITRDLDIELPAEEKLWNASTVEEWETLRENERASPPRTIRNVMEDMLGGKTDNCSHNSSYYVSGFTSLVIIHGANVYAWNLNQLSNVHFAPFRDLSGVGTNALLTNALTTLARCGEVLQLAKSENTEPFWNSPEGPLLFNCEAILRVAYSRLFLSASMPEGVVLFLNNREDYLRSLANFVAAPQERSPIITRVMTSMYEAFSVPSKAGYLLVQKTAAIHWSVEHAIAGWNCVFLLSKWLHDLETSSETTSASSEELEVVMQVKTALEGMDTDYDDTGSLAAAVVASWAPLMTDIWVWSVTNKMGTILMDLAQAYRTSFDNAMEARRRN